MFFTLLEGKRKGWVRAGSTERLPTLPSPTTRRCPAVLLPDPTGQWCVWVLDLTD